eukprot:3564709-Pyramimonas_sp.AAC.1
MYAPQSGLLAGVNIPTAHFMTNQMQDGQEHIDNQHWSAVSVPDDENPWGTFSGAGDDYLLNSQRQTTTRASPLDWSGDGNNGAASTISQTSPISQLCGMTRSDRTSLPGQRVPDADLQDDHARRGRGKGKKGKKGKDKSKGHDHDQHDDRPGVQEHSGDRPRMTDQSVRDLTAILGLGSHT